MTGARLYIVEDESLIAMELEDRLRRLGYEIAGRAARGEVAMRELAALQPDLVLMDIQLTGGLSGVDIAGWLQAELQIPVIFLTAFSDPALLARAQHVEPLGYLVKPFEERELHATIQVALFRHRSGAERRRADEERRALEERLLHAQKSESLGRMAGAIAHSFNNLLTVVISGIELARERAHDEAGRDARLAQAAAAAARAAALSRAMRQYVEAPGLRHGAVDLGRIYRDALAQAQTTRPSGARLTAAAPPARLWVRGDQEQIRGMLVNLVTNAVEALDGREGHIELAIEEVGDDTIRAWRTYPRDWVPPAGRYACLRVRDSGCGMTDEVLERIFDPFYSTKFPGRGLGLALALSTARAGGGAIAVETSPGRGSTFRVLMLIVSPAPGTPEPPGQAPSAPTARA
jgi:signal transduction histidine kinase